ncbi:MAG: integrase core domain-containing protein, partial [Thermoplasmatales archaeon]
LRSAMKLLGIKLEYIQKHTHENNGDIESFHNSIKTDYIWPNEFRDFHEASITIGKAFSDYYECRPYSSIDYLPPREFRRKFLDDPAFRERYEKKEVEVTLDEK